MEVKEKEKQLEENSGTQTQQNTIVLEKNSEIEPNAQAKSDVQVEVNAQAESEQTIPNIQQNVQDVNDMLNIEKLQNTENPQNVQNVQEAQNGLNEQENAEAKKWQQHKNDKVMKIGVSVVITVLILIVGIVAAIIHNQYVNTHFPSKTSISKVDCSGLTVAQAEKKIKEAKQEVTLIISSPNSEKQKKYIIPQKELEKLKWNAPNEEKLQYILETAIEKRKKSQEEQNFISDNMFSVNEKAVKEYLNNLYEQNEDTIVKAQNAKLELDQNNNIVIKPEVYGNEVEFEKAYKLLVKSLKQGNNQIDFTSVMKVPEIVAADEKLVNAQKELSSILSTNIKYNLNDGSIVALNSEVIKNWLKEGEDGTLTIDVDKNLSEFVDSLAEKVTEANKYMTFTTTGKGNTTLYVRSGVRPGLNKEKTLEQLKAAIGTSHEENLKLNYDRAFVKDMMKQYGYIEVSIIRQTIWVYNSNGQCILTTPCVTGVLKNGKSRTTTGIFYLLGKQTNRTLRGKNDDGSSYASFVNYWMWFYGGIGFHDASWRNKFGGTIYKYGGSHGCVNMPYSAAQKLYSIINSNMPIIVYDNI